MAILSKIKSAAKKVASTIKSAITGKSNTASAINALKAPAKGSFVANAQKPYTGQGQNTTKDQVTYGLSTLPKSSGNILSNTIASSNRATNTSMGGVAPVSYTSLMTPSSFKAGTSTSKSDTSTASFNIQPTSSSFASSSPISTSVSGSSLGVSSKGTNIGSAPSGTNYQGTAIGGNVSVGAEPTTGYIPTASVTGTTGEDTTAEKPKTSLETLLASLRKPADETDAYAKAQKDSGILQAQQRVANTQNEVNAVTAKMNSDLLQLRGTAQQEGVTEAVYGGQQAQITREATIRLLPLQAQLANDQGNLELAESHLDTLFKVYSKDAQNSVDYYNNLAKMVYEDATASEKRQLDEQARNKDFERSLLKDNINFQQSTASQALKDGNVRLYKAVTAVQPPTNINSPTYAKDKQNYLDDINEAVSKYGQVATVAKSQGVLSSLPTSIQNRVIGLADGVKNTDIAKKYLATADSINIVNGIDPKSKNPADHQQIVYAFAKALDPDSAVREGEYSTIKKYAQGAFSRYGKEISNAINGTGFLSEGAIKNIQSTMNNTYTSRKPLYDTKVNETARIINSIAGSDVASELMTDYSAGINTGQANNDPLGIL